MQTIFEVNSTSKTKAFEIMKVKRVKHDASIEKSQQKKEMRQEDSTVVSADPKQCQQEHTNDDDLNVGIKIQKYNALLLDLKLVLRINSLFEPSFIPLPH